VGLTCGFPPAREHSPEHLQIMMLKGPTMVSNMMVNARLAGMSEAAQEALPAVEVSSACWMLAQVRGCRARALQRCWEAFGGTGLGSASAGFG
jgi:hypothetical protein